MKIAFSTLACPKWSFNEVFSVAKDLFFDGIEIRGIGNELYVPKIREFDNNHIDETLEKLKNANLEISILSSAAEIAKANNGLNAKKEVKEYIDIAEKLNVKYVRLLCTQSIDKEDCDLEQAVKIYESLCEYGKSKGVTPLIETNGKLCDTKILKKFIEDCKSDNKGVLWDIHHPYRFNYESVEDTISNIGKYIKYVHIKDSIYSNGKLTYTLLGKGDLPVKEAIDGLKAINYNGYISLEWLKRWLSDLEEPGIVLSHFSHEIRNLI